MNSSFNRWLFRNSVILFIRVNRKDMCWLARIYYKASLPCSRLCVKMLYILCVELLQHPCEVGVTSSILQTDFEDQVTQLATWPPGKKKG